MIMNEQFRGVILNAVGYGYIEATDPEREKDKNENGDSIITVSDEEMETVEKIAAYVIVHVGAYLGDDVTQYE